MSVENTWLLVIMLSAVGIIYGVEKLLNRVKIKQESSNND